MKNLRKVNLRKMFIILTVFIISSFAFSAGENYYDYKAILVGDTKGNIFKEDNSYAVRPLASVTKVIKYTAGRFPLMIWLQFQKLRHQFLME